MLRFLTAGESHGQALVVTVDGMPAGLQLDILAGRPASATPRGVRTRAEDGHRKRPGGNTRRGSSWPNDGRTDRPVDSKSRLGQLAADDVRRAGHARRRQRRTTGGGHPTAAGACGPRRGRQVRSRGHSRHPGASQRQGNRGARGGRQPGSAGSRPLRRVASHVSVIGDVMLGKAGPSRSRKPRPFRRTPRFVASTWTSSNA
jgi:hypothetical protein